jgi:uncharacterized protein
MQDGSYYVYALKDPRKSPAMPFYIGKGVGNRAWDHELNPDETRKGRHISEIQQSGHKIVVSKICEGLTEMQALRIEAELIATFGTLETGGILANSVVPSGTVRRNRRNVIVPYGAPEKAQLGLALLKDAVLELARANKGGVTNADVSHSLGLHSTYKGGSKDYLSWSILGLLMKDGLIERDNNLGHGRHVARVF